MRPTGYDVLGTWAPEKDGTRLISPHNHDVTTSSRLVGLVDPENMQRSPLERVLLEYDTDGKKYPLYTFGQIVKHVSRKEEGFKQRLRGDLAEHIARRVMKRILHKLKIGKSGGIYDARFRTAQHEGYTVASQDNIVLKVHNYPNLVLLERRGEDKPCEYNVTDLDGLFDHRIGQQRHLIVVEAKEGHIKLKEETLMHTFDCMEQLYPKAAFSYVLFGTDRYLFSGKRRLQDRHVDLYHRLIERNIATVFFTFNESRQEIADIRNHLYQHYVLAKQKSFRLATGLVNDEEISIYDTMGNILKQLRKKENGDYEDLTAKQALAQ